MLLSSHLTFSSVTMVTLFMVPLASDGNGWGRSLTVHRMGRPIWLLNSSSFDVILWWPFTRDTNMFTFFAHVERSVYTLFSPVVFLSNFPIMFLPSLWLSSQVIGYSPWISEQPHIWLFLFQAKFMAMYSSQSFAHSEDFMLRIGLVLYVCKC